MREKAYARHYFIVDYLRAQPVGRRLDQIHKAVSEAFETCERTTRRDIGALRAGGFPIREDKSPAGTFYRYVGPSMSSPPVSFDPVEAASLVLARDALLANGEVFFSERIDGLIERLGKFQNDAFHKSLRKLQKSLYCQSPGPALQPHCDKVIRAIDERVKLRLDYRNAAGRLTKDRLVAPIQFWISNLDTYLVAHCYRRNEIRFFSLKRMQKVQLTDEHFDEDWAFDAEERAKNSLGVMPADPEVIEMEFDDMLVEYFNTHPIHATQQMLRRNGTNVLRLKLGVNETLVHQLLGFGPRVTVTRPERLRTLLQRRLGEAIARYNAPVAGGESLPLEFS